MATLTSRLRRPSTYKILNQVSSSYKPNKTITKQPGGGKSRNKTKQTTGDIQNDFFKLSDFVKALENDTNWKKMQKLYESEIRKANNKEKETKSDKDSNNLFYPIEIQKPEGTVKYLHNLSTTRSLSSQPIPKLPRKPLFYSILNQHPFQKYSSNVFYYEPIYPKLLQIQSNDKFIQKFSTDLKPKSLFEKSYRTLWKLMEILYQKTKFTTRIGLPAGSGHHSRRFKSDDSKDRKDNDLVKPHIPKYNSFNDEKSDLMNVDMPIHLNSSVSGNAKIEECMQNVMNALEEGGKMGQLSPEEVEKNIDLLAPRTIIKEKKDGEGGDNIEEISADFKDEEYTLNKDKPEGFSKLLDHVSPEDHTDKIIAIPPSDAYTYEPDFRPEKIPPELTEKIHNQETGENWEVEVKQVSLEDLQKLTPEELSHNACTIILPKDIANLTDLVSILKNVKGPIEGKSPKFVDIDKIVKPSWLKQQCSIDSAFPKTFAADCYIEEAKNSRQRTHLLSEECKNHPLSFTASLNGPFLSERSNKIENTLKADCVSDMLSGISAESKKLDELLANIAKSCNVVITKFEPPGVSGSTSTNADTKESYPIKPVSMVNTIESKISNAKVNEPSDHASAAPLKEKLQYKNVDLVIFEMADEEELSDNKAPHIETDENLSLGQVNNMTEYKNVNLTVRKYETDKNQQMMTIEVEKPSEDKKKPPSGDPNQRQMFKSSTNAIVENHSKETQNSILSGFYEEVLKLVDGFKERLDSHEREVQGSKSTQKTYQVRDGLDLESQIKKAGLSAFDPRNKSNVSGNDILKNPKRNLHTVNVYDPDHLKLETDFLKHLNFDQTTVMDNAHQKKLIEPTKKLEIEPKESVLTKATEQLKKWFFI